MNKHKMNKISGYYEGAGGVFYDVKFDEYFILEETPGYILRRENKEVIGKIYMYHDKRVPKGRQSGMAGFEHVIRVCDL